MAVDDNDIKNKKPNTLERLGSDIDISRSYRRDLDLAMQRSEMQTLEMRKVYEEIRRRDEELKAAQRQYYISDPAKSPSDQYREFIKTVAPRVRIRQEDVEKLTASEIPEQRLKTFSEKILQTYEVSSSKKNAELSEKAENLRKERQLDAERLLQQHVMSSIKNVSTGRRALMQEPGVQEVAEQYFGAASISDLRKGAERTTAALYRSGEKLVEASKGALDPGGKEAYLAAGETYETVRRKSASIELAIKMKEQQRKEDALMLESTSKLAERIGSRSTREAIKEQALGGQYGTASDIRKAVVQKESELVEALSKFKEELKSTGEVTSETREKLGQARDSLSEYSDALRPVKRDSEERFRKGVERASGITSLLSYGLVGADEAQMQLRTQAAAMMNRRFSDAYSASQGDMAALRRFTQNTFGTAAAFGSAYSTRAEIGAGANMTVGALGAVGKGGIDFLLGTGKDIGTAAFEVVKGNAGEAIKAGIGGLKNRALKIAEIGIDVANETGRQGIDLSKGITGAQAELGFAAQYYNLTDTVNQVPDRARQAYFDFKTSVGRGLLGAGTGARMLSLYNEASAMDTVQQLAKLGIRADDVGELFGGGAKAIGPSFGAGTGRAMVTRAAEVQRSGMMSAQQYLQNIGQLTNVGGGEKTMEDIMASAVARGVDDAKSLKGIVDITQMLSRDAASRGVPVAPGVEAAVSTGLGMFAGLPVDEALKQNLTAGILQRTLERQREGGVNLENLMAVTELGRYGISPVAAGKIATTDTIESRRLFETYKGKITPGKEIPKDVLQAVGEFAEVFVDPKTGLVRPFEQMQEIMDIAPSIKTTGLLFGGKTREQRKTELQSGTRDLSTIEYIAGGYHIGGRGAALDILSKDAQEAARERERVNLENTMGQYTDVQRIFGAQALGQAGLISGGQGPLSAFANQMEAAAAAVDVEKAGIEAAGAAEKITIDTTQFDQSITNFATAVNNFANAVRPLGMATSALSGGGLAIPGINQSIEASYIGRGVIMK